MSIFTPLENFKLVLVKRKKVKDEALKRTQKQSLLFNKREMRAINRYCSQYKVSNKSKFMRETIITAILEKFDQDLPSLFEDQPTLFDQKKVKKTKRN